MLKLKKWFLSGSNGDGSHSFPSTLDKLTETLTTLEKKECVLQNKISIETERYKDCTKSRNNKGAVQCLKRKAYYESQLVQLQNVQLQVNDQMKMFKGMAVASKH